MSINPDRLKLQQPINQPKKGHFSIEEELQIQREILLKIYENTRKTRRYVLFGRIISAIYLILIIAPLVLAAIYLPPILKDAAGPYKELLNLNSAQPKTNLDLNQIDVNKANQLLKMLK